MAWPVMCCRGECVSLREARGQQKRAVSPFPREAQGGAEIQGPSRRVAKGVWPLWRPPPHPPQPSMLHRAAIPRLRPETHRRGRLRARPPLPPSSLSLGKAEAASKWQAEAGSPLLGSAAPQNSESRARGVSPPCPFPGHGCQRGCGHQQHQTKGDACTLPVSQSTPTASAPLKLDVRRGPFTLGQWAHQPLAGSKKRREACSSTSLLLRSLMRRGRRSRPASALNRKGCTAGMHSTRQFDRSRAAS